MKVFISWAHRGEGWTDTQAEAWRRTVETFADVLDDNTDIDVTLDRWHIHDRDTDWFRWGLRNVEEADFIVIAMNQPWADRWRGANHPRVGAGVVAEADALRGLFVRDQVEFQRRVRIVMLPDSEERDIPLDLYRLNRATINVVDPAGVNGLVEDLRGTPTRSVHPGSAQGSQEARASLVLDDRDLLVFRYRDLTRPTLDSHRRVLDANPAGYVWWGWWKKFPENPQVYLWQALSQRLRQGPCRIALFDSGSPNGEIRRATVSEVLVPRLDDFDDCHPFLPPSPEWPYIPAYYRPESADDQTFSCAWLRLTAIEVQPFSRSFYGKYQLISPEVSHNGRIIALATDLSSQEQTLWHVRERQSR